MKNKVYFLLTCMFFSAALLNAQKKIAVTQYANTSLSNLTSPTAINVNLLPDKDNNHNIGNSTKAWKNLYLDSAIYIDSTRFIAFRTGTGSGNTALGKDVLYSTTDGSSNTGVGYRALYYNTTGYENTAMGRSALYLNTVGNDNMAMGYHALYSNTESFNTAIGAEAMLNNTSGYENVGIGTFSMHTNQTGYADVACGESSLYSNTNGYSNVAIGTNALYYNTSGSSNVSVGDAAGQHVKTGTGNIFIGTLTDCGSGGSLTNSTAIGNAVKVNTSNTVRIGNSFVTSIGGYTNWSNVSDGRIKKNIKQNVPGLSFINKLQPVTYTLDLDAADKILEFTTKDGKPSQFDIDARKAKEQIVYTGFVAQDVEKSAKELNYNFSGVDKPGNANALYGLRYSDFVVPLVKAVQELSKMNDDKDEKINNLQKQIDDLKAMIISNQSTVNAQHPTVVSSASLQQNIPNPFSNSTTINYSLPAKYLSAKMIITDKNGNALKQINLSNSRGPINVDASTLASGAYQYALYVDGKLIASKQMILSK